MKEISKIDKILKRNQKLKSILETSETHSQLHHLISNTLSQYIEFHILLQDEILTIKVTNGNDWHHVHFAQQKIKATLINAGIPIKKIIVKKSIQN